MKKTLFFALLISSLASCQKKQCWRCTVTTKAYTSGVNPTSTTTTEQTVCDKTSDEIQAYQRQLSSSTIANGGTTAGVLVETSAVCR